MRPDPEPSQGGKSTAESLQALFKVACGVIFMMADACRWVLLQCRPACPAQEGPADHGVVEEGEYITIMVEPPVIEEFVEAPLPRHSSQLEEISLSP